MPKPYYYIYMQMILHLKYFVIYFGIWELENYLLTPYLAIKHLTE